MAQNDTQKALLKNRLQMPLIVRDLLITNQNPAAEAHYALHEILGNYQPDTALLCAAFTMKEIANFEAVISTDLSFLHMECDRLIERYSARDDLADCNPYLWSETQAEMMNVLAEDLEGFLELVSLCYMSFEITNLKIAKLINIIATQLQSHIMIVDEVISMLAMNTKQNNPLNTPTVTGLAAENVIAFPC